MGSFEIQKRYIITVNVGDSPSLIILDGGSHALTTMHSASNPMEQEQFRIRRCNVKRPFKIAYNIASNDCGHNGQSPCNTTPDIDIVNDAFPSEYSLLKSHHGTVQMEFIILGHF